MSHLPSRINPYSPNHLFLCNRRVAHSLTPTTRLFPAFRSLACGTYLFKIRSFYNGEGPVLQSEYHTDPFTMVEYPAFTTSTRASVKTLRPPCCCVPLQLHIRNDVNASSELRLFFEFMASLAFQIDPKILQCVKGIQILRFSINVGRVRFSSPG